MAHCSFASADVPTPGRAVTAFFRRCAAALGATLALSLAAAPMLRADDPPPANALQRLIERAQPEVRPLAAFTKFPDWVASVAFSPRGDLLAAGSYGTISLIDVREKKEMATLEEKSGFVKSLAFSPDGKLLVGGSYQVAGVWDVISHMRLRSLKGHRGYITGVAFSPDGSRIATSSEDETVRVWDSAQGAAQLTLVGHELPVTGVAFAPGGRMVSSCSGDSTRPGIKGDIRLWDAASGNALRTITGHSRGLNALAFSPDGKLVASASTDETVKLFNCETGAEVRTLEGHSRPVTSLAFLPDGLTLASASGGRFNGGNEVRFWDIATGTARATLAAHDGPVQQIAVTSDGKLLATASSDKSAKLWEISLAVAERPRGEPVAQTPAGGETPTKATPTAERDSPPRSPAVREFRVGIIGLDTSHVVAFTQVLNDKAAQPDVAGCRVVAAFPKGSPDIESSTSRVPEYTQKLQEMGVEIVDSLDALLPKVDVVLLETNDGRPHREQVLPVLKAGKPVFVDKPLAGSLADAIAIFDLAREYRVPLFSSSSLRYSPGAQALRQGKIGEIIGCDAYSPCSLEKTHPDLFWYGIHGVESLFTVMGAGCEQVTRISTPGCDVAAGVWQGGRIGTFRGVRAGQSGYGGTAFGTKGIEPIGPYGGYRPLLVEIVKFFRTGIAPVSPEETLEIYAFMEAADESQRQGGKPVTLKSVLDRAREKK